MSPIFYGKHWTVHVFDPTAAVNPKGECWALCSQGRFGQAKRVRVNAWMEATAEPVSCEGCKAEARRRAELDDVLVEANR